MSRTGNFIALSLALLTVGDSAWSAVPREANTLRFGSRGTVLLFVASMCPCTDAHRVMINRLVEQAQPQGFNFCCVFPNAGETSATAQHFFRSIRWDMDYVMDAKGVLTDRYRATNTPQAFVLDRDGSVLYNGPIDDSNKNQGRVDHAYLRDAIEDILAGRPVRTPHVPPAGCWIVRSTKSRATDTGS